MEPVKATDSQKHCLVLDTNFSSDTFDIIDKSNIDFNHSSNNTSHSKCEPVGNVKLNCETLFLFNDDQNGGYSDKSSYGTFNLGEKYAQLPLINKIKKPCLKTKLEEFQQRKFYQAVSTNNIEKVQIILESGVSPNVSDKQGRTPLHLASCRGYADMVKLLLDHGANPNLRDCIGNTPLHLAAVASNVSVVTLLLKAGTDVLSLDNHGHNPLQVAESKLRIIQNYKGPDFSRIKEEVHSITNMLLAYFEVQRDRKQEIDDLRDFYSRHSLSSSSDQVQDNVRDLLSKISLLNIN